MGQTSLSEMRLFWLVGFLLLLAATVIWWTLYLWLLVRLGGLLLRDGLGRSTPLLVLLSFSLIPGLAVFLSGRLPYNLPFDEETRSAYVWILG
ncbi:MAG TPA: hypothetical protein VHS28_08125, partial [Chloroflexota bacterium]|nr:hypothetical protein [Chloroflexota bacterium]